MTTQDSQLHPSGLDPAGQAILCEVYMPEILKSMIELPDHVLALEMMREMRATVLVMGEACYSGMAPRCKVGDNVLISKFAGTMVKGPMDNKLYRIVNDQDVFCRLHGDMSKMIIEDPIVQSKRLKGEAAGQANKLQEKAA